MSDPLAHAQVVDSAGFCTFRNALCILLNLEPDDLLAAGVISDPVGFRRFEDDPFRFFIKADAIRAAALWVMIHERQSDDMRADTAS